MHCTDMAGARARYSAISQRRRWIGVKTLPRDAHPNATLVCSVCFRRIADVAWTGLLQPRSPARPSVGTVKPPSFESHSYFFILQDKMVSLATTVRHRGHRGGTTTGGHARTGGRDRGGAKSDG
jgi:hypothetical protein